ncbi:multiheme c-type cytochrome [Desulfosarcina sp.]|uniref:multiheme c-type cytochrome n=1 Tax=Desulfosarcina sp. TaxID=2027861 RepID=UPI003970A03C
MGRLLSAVMVSLVLLTGGTAFGDAAPVSSATQECLDCHAIYHPGIVADWQKSRHAMTSPKTAMTVQGLQRRMSGSQVPDPLLENSVGCAECHTLRGGDHADTFAHNGYDIHVVVSPDDCATCHPVERAQYAQNIMALAEKNLSENTLYADLQRSILGTASVKPDQVHFVPANDLTRAEACYFCHGTRLRVTGTETRDTDAGELEFPVIAGWPNQGVGRVNLDGSRGACSACHTRHRFSIEMARKPYTCKACHVGPDVPAFKVYSASKHGNIFSSMQSGWDFNTVPWVIGEDIQAPTCATCHISLTVNTDGEVINPRTHQMSDRLGWRIFGLIYAHPQPKSPDTTPIRNKAGLPLPTDLDGSLAVDYLISADEAAARRTTMQRTCLACHDASWVNGHFERLDNTIVTSNQAVLTATGLITSVWEKGYAQGLAGGGSIFDEYIERCWSDVWLLYANNIRFASAMAGGGDYGVFEDGRYHLTKSILEMHAWQQTRDLIMKNP